MVLFKGEDNNQLSLRGRLSILLIVMLLPFFCFSIYQSVMISDRLEKEAQDENLRLAKRIAISLDEYIISTGEVLIPIANNESVRNQDLPKTKELLDRILRKYPYYNSISFVDINGIKQVMSKHADMSRSKPPTEVDNSVRDFPFFKRGIEASGISVGDFKFCGVTNMPIVHITYPVFDKEEQRVGLVAAAFDLTKLQAKLMSPEIPAYVTIGVIDNNGIVVARNREPKKFIGKDLSKEPFFKNMYWLKQGADTAVATDGVKRAFGFERASRVPWYVRAGIDTEYIKAQAKTEFLQQLFMFVPFVLLSILGWFWAGKSVDRVHTTTGQLSLTDPLTGLWNLRKLHQDLDYEFGRAKRYNNKLSFAMIDIDFFKHYNDQNGHQAGDEALRLVSELIRKSVRDADIAYRYGGEEMCVLLSTTDKEGAAFLAERIKRSIEIFSFAGGETQPSGRLTVSIGVATYPDDSSFRDGLVKSADVALYKAKNMGRNRVEVYGGTTPAHELHESDASPSTNAKILPASDSESESDMKAGSMTGCKKAADELDQMAHYDVLTGLPNRVLLTDRLNIALAHARRYEENIAVVCLDVDDLKPINNTLGYQVGDELLQGVAERLRVRLRESDTIARINGDAFVLLLRPVKNRDDISKVAQELLDEIKRPFILDEQKIFVTISAGISFFPTDGQDAHSLLINANRALALAKNKGKDNCQFFVDDMNEYQDKKFAMVNHIRSALEKKEFRVYYQPIIQTNTGRIMGAEALIRWIHPELGIVMPADFIGLAEEYGLIVPIGEWVLRTACLQNKCWLETGYEPIKVSVNLSARQIQQHDFFDMVERVLHETELDPKYLELEITESVFMKDAERAISILNRLRTLGVDIAIDDFGTGYSSLSYLRQFPVNKLKIDRSFVNTLETDPVEPAIVKAIIELAHSLGLTTVAEGVETKGQLEILHSLKCCEIQGFFFSKPLPADEFIKFLASNEGLCA